MACEAWSDRALPYIDVSYMRMGAIDMDSPVLKYTFPEWTATIFGESPGDYQSHEQRHALRLCVGSGAAPLQRIRPMSR